MPNFSKQSVEKLKTCHLDLQVIMQEAIREMDFTILCGFRGKAEQNLAFTQGKSKLRFPRSKHNFLPSNAVDIAPYPIDWNNIERFKQLSEIVHRIAKEKGIKIEWGGNWKMGDFPHYELK